MALDPEVCWRASSARDARFIGRFVMAVTSTHIYCRPGCPARLPARRNARFYATPAAAEAAGFRACLRCRPDRAPGAPTAAGTAATVARALRLMDDGALTDGSLETLAGRLGVTSRWLRELFERHVGAAPLDVARTRRAHLARRLIEETPLPMEDVAIASGYGSARRMRSAMGQVFALAPSALRRRVPGPGGAGCPSDGALELQLAARPPFDAAPLLAFFAGRAIPGVEEVIGETYRRTVSLEGRPAVLELRTRADGVTLRLSPGRPSPLGPVAALPRVIARVSRLFDLDADAEAIARWLTRDPRLARALRGRVVRVPGAFDAFEAGVRALLGQQVSVAAARTLAGRLAAVAGEPLPAPHGTLTHVFPDAARVARAPLERLGLPSARAAALRGFARAVASGELDLGAFRDLDDAVAKLTRLPGIGDWTAQYVAMRALGEPDAFPAGDLGVRQALVGAPGSTGSRKLPSEREARARAERWRPWRAYAVIALWTEHAGEPRTPRATSRSNARTASRHRMARPRSLKRKASS